MFNSTNNENKNIYSVSELNNLARDFLESNPYLSNVRVEGEISSFSKYSYGAFFSIIDDKCRLDGFLPISCFAYSYIPKIGDKVVVTGGLTIFPKNGKYQIRARKMEQQGLGEELIKLKLLAQKLAKEGLFDEDRKRSLPKFPKKIGVIAGKDSAAMADIIKNTYRRYPLVTLNLHPSLVQGVKAPRDLIANLLEAYEEGNDVIIIARGGGSKEDLSAFNDEDLVRVVANSPCPIIAAIGHEIDFSLVDYAADKRVSTPTGAAEAATPNIEHIIDDILYFERSINEIVNRNLNMVETNFANLSSRPVFVKPTAIYDIYEDRINSSAKSILKYYNYYINTLNNKLNFFSETFDHLNPDKVIERGYSLSFDKDGKIINSISEVKSGDEILTKFKDGKILSEVKEKKL